MGVVALLIQELTGKNVFLLTRFPLTVRQALPLSTQFHQQIQTLLPTLPRALNIPSAELAEQSVPSETLVTTEVVPNTLSVILGDPLQLIDEDGEHPDEDGELNEISGSYRAHYDVLGDVAVAAIASILTNPFEASLCLRRTKRVLVAACKTGPDGLVTSKELQKPYGEVFFALERVLDGDEGVGTFSARLQDVQPHIAENSHESGRIAVLNATKTWKEALDEYAEYQNNVEQTTALVINIKADEDAPSDDLSFESSWSAPLVKTRSNKWTEISYENKEKEPEGTTMSRGKGKDKTKNKGTKKPKKEKEKKDKEKGKNKGKGKEKGGKEKKEKKSKKRENDSGRSDPEKERNPTGEALAKKKKALGGAQRKLSIGMERRGGRGGT